MARYIRTKDGRIVDTEKEYLSHPANYSIQARDYGLTVKQADTIEELCDEFVVAYEDGSRIVYSDLAWAKTKANASLDFGHKSIIYGAIWTEWGLKYVAKMDNEGNLKLI